MSDDYMEEYIEEVAKGLRGKQPGEVPGELKKLMLILEYTDQATKGMKGTQRNDVARELRTHILDSADALAAERNVPVDEHIVREVLEKMGRAKKIAAMYPAKKTIFGHDLGKALLSLASVALAFLALVVVLQLAAPDTLKMALPGSNAGADILSILMSLVFALSIAIAVIAAIFIAMYLYETSLKTPYEARLKAFEKSLNEVSSPIRAAGKIIGTTIWLVLLNLFWSRVPFVQSFGGNGTDLVPLMSGQFAPFLLYFNIIGVVEIILAVLYLAVRRKWIPSLMEAGINLCNALLFIWVLTAFPFNSALSTGPTVLIKFVLAIIIVGCLAATAKQLWDAMKFALYGKLDTNDTV